MVTPPWCHTVRAKLTTPRSRTSPLRPVWDKLRQVPPLGEKESPSTTVCSKSSVNLEQARYTRGIRRIRAGGVRRKRYKPPKAQEACKNGERRGRNGFSKHTERRFVERIPGAK